MVDRKLKKVLAVILFSGTLLGCSEQEVQDYFSQEFLPSYGRNSHLSDTYSNTVEPRTDDFDSKEVNMVELDDVPAYDFSGPSTFNTGKNAETLQISNTEVSNISVNHNSWYTDLKNQRQDRSNVVKIGNSTAYKGLPWDTEDDTYFYNVYKAKSDLYDYLKEIGVNPNQTKERVLNQCNGDYEYMPPCLGKFNRWAFDINQKSSIRSESDGTHYLIKDGVKCYFCAPQPAVYYRKYYSSGKWAQGGSVENKKGNKFALVFVKDAKDVEDTSKYIYLPVIAGDTKGHTYPWGVVQTCLNVKSKTRVDGYPSQSWVVTDVSDKSSIKKICSEYRNSSYTIFDFMDCSYETFGWSKTMYAEANKYINVGYVVWPE